MKTEIPPTPPRDPVPTEKEPAPTVVELKKATPTICLARVTSDLRKTRDQVAQYLTSAGIRILPAKPYSADPAKFVQAFEADLQEAHVFVQILGESYSDRSEEFPHGEETAQYDLARQRNIVALQWRAKAVRLELIDDQTHRELVSGPNVICNDLVEFAMLVKERAQRIQEVGRPQPVVGEERQALVKANKQDDPLAREIIAFLIKSKINCLVARNGQSMIEYLRETHYDAFVVVYGECPDDWLEKRGKEFQAVDLNLKDQAPVRA